MADELKVGRLLRAGTSGFVVGTRVTQWETPSFGGLVRAPLSASYQIFGVIYDIHIDDDGLVRQLITAEGVDPAVIADNRENRNIPIEMSVITIGYQENGQIFHSLPPRPPLSLDQIYYCSPKEIREFTSQGRLGYFRHMLRLREISVADLLAAHIQQTQAAYTAVDVQDWAMNAIEELVVLLRNDYSTLMEVLPHGRGYRSLAGLSFEFFFEMVIRRVG